MLQERCKIASKSLPSTRAGGRKRWRSAVAVALQRCEPRTTPHWGLPCTCRKTIAARRSKVRRWDLNSILEAVRCRGKEKKKKSLWQATYLNVVLFFLHESKQIGKCYIEIVDLFGWLVSEGVHELLQLPDVLYYKCHPRELWVGPLCRMLALGQFSKAMPYPALIPNDQMLYESKRERERARARARDVSWPAKGFGIFQ